MPYLSKGSSYDIVPLSAKAIVGRDNRPRLNAIFNDHISIGHQFNYGLPSFMVKGIFINMVTVIEFHSEEKLKQFPSKYTSIMDFFISCKTF